MIKIAAKPSKKSVGVVAPVTGTVGEGLTPPAIGEADGVGVAIVVPPVPPLTEMVKVAVAVSLVPALSLPVTVKV